MATDEYSLRTGTPDDWENSISIMSEAFADTRDPEVEEGERAVYEPERTVLVTYGDEFVGNAGAFTRDLTVPGAVIPAAHVTMVAVRPTHRRRGVLTRMMRHQLADIAARGEAVALLWASEGRIYQRFGYGLAAQRLHLDIGREVQLTDPPGLNEGRLRDLAPDDLLEVVPKIYEQVRAERVGWSNRDANWWRYVLSDPSERRNGASARRVTVHNGQSGVDGYALWRVKPEWDRAGAKGEVQIRELVATNPDAYRALWRLMLDVDLTRRVNHWYAALDEPLLHLVNEPRRLLGTLADALWVRLVDVPAALAARRYLTEVDVVIEVNDPVRPANTGRYHLVGGPDGAACTPTDREADLGCAVNALGAAYLGGSSLSALAAAGRVVEYHPGALARAGVAFGWHRAPSATEVF